MRQVSEKTENILEVEGTTWEGEVIFRIESEISLFLLPRNWKDYFTMWNKTSLML